jgi:NAD(P)-dependent dehydrogenase (short-subunit alcohol dehydrogenase family)
MDLQLHGKRAIVTGGSRGIGKQVARALIAEGVRVAIAARDRAALDAAAAELGADTVALSFDAGSTDSVRSMVAMAVEALGGVEILVNSAAQPGGQSTPPKLAEIGDEMFWNDVNVKVMGYLRCIREVVPHLGQGGRIVNISGLAARSTGSLIGSVRNVGVAALTKNLADELGPLGISAVVVHPGTVRTEKTPEVVRWRASQTGASEEEVLQAMARRNVLGRIIDASEVAAVVAFLCSPRAIGINGDAIAVGGGIPSSIYY